MGSAREMLRAVPAGHTYPGTATCPCLPGICKRSPGVLCPSYPAVTVQEGPRQRHGVQDPKLWLLCWARKAESCRKVKMKESFWFPGKSPLLPHHRCGGTGCPLSLPWHGPSASPSPPSLCQHQCDHWRKTLLLLKEKLLCCVPHFSACLWCLFNIMLL